MQKANRSVLVLCGFLFVVQAGVAQIPIRNYIHWSAEAIEAALDEMELPYDVVEDDWIEEGKTIYLYPSNDMGYSANSATFFLERDSCLSIQYDFFDDPDVLKSVRAVIESKQAFTPCGMLANCWVHEREEGSRFIWNLFFNYQGVENWGVLLIEDEQVFETNRMMYEREVGK